MKSFLRGWLAFLAVIFGLGTVVYACLVISAIVGVESSTPEDLTGLVVAAGIFGVVTALFWKWCCLLKKKTRGVGTASVGRTADPASNRVISGAYEGCRVKSRKGRACVVSQFRGELELNEDFLTVYQILSVKRTALRQMVYEIELYWADDKESVIQVGADIWEVLPPELEAEELPAERPDPWD